MNKMIQMRLWLLVGLCCAVSTTLYAQDVTCPPGSILDHVARTQVGNVVTITPYCRPPNKTEIACVRDAGNALRQDKQFCAGYFCSSETDTARTEFNDCQKQCVGGMFGGNGGDFAEHYSECVDHCITDYPLRGVKDAICNAALNRCWEDVLTKDKNRIRKCKGG
jgi:hypothetical protein